MIELGRTPTKEEVEALIQNLWERAQDDAEDFQEMKSTCDRDSREVAFQDGVAVAHTYILDGIAQWADINDISINVNLEEWAKENLS